ARRRRGLCQMKIDKKFDADLRLGVGGPARTQTRRFEQASAVNPPPRSTQRLFDLLPSRPRLDLNARIGRLARLVPRLPLGSQQIGPRRRRFQIVTEDW